MVVPVDERVLINKPFADVLLGFDLPFIDTGIDTPPEAAIAIIIVIYAIAALFNLYIPRTGVPMKPPTKRLTPSPPAPRRSWRTP